MGLVAGNWFYVDCLEGDTTHTPIPRGCGKKTASFFLLGRLAPQDRITPTSSISGISIFVGAVVAKRAAAARINRLDGTGRAASPPESFTVSPNGRQTLADPNHLSIAVDVLNNTHKRLSFASERREEKPWVLYVDLPPPRKRCGVDAAQRTPIETFRGGCFFASTVRRRSIDRSIDRHPNERTSVQITLYLASDWAFEHHSPRLVEKETVDSIQLEICEIYISCARGEHPPPLGFPSPSLKQNEESCSSYPSVPSSGVAVSRRMRRGEAPRKRCVDADDGDCSQQQQQR